MRNIRSVEKAETDDRIKGSRSSFQKCADTKCWFSSLQLILLYFASHVKY